MDKTKTMYAVLLGTVLVLVSSIGEVAVAADCKALNASIRKERGLMQKKALIEDAMKVCPKDAEVVYQNGYTFERLRKYEDAIKYYRKAISLDNDFAKAYFSIGDIQMLLKNYQEAVDSYISGLGHAPSDRRARASLKEARQKYRQLTGKEAPDAPGGVVATVKKASGAAPPPKTRAKAVPKKASGPASFAEVPILRLQVPFHKKTASLSQDAKDVLSVVVGQAMNRSDMRGSSFEVGGHTDNQGDASKNYEISKKRANAAHRYLTKDLGVAATRLKLAYHGQKKPRVPNSSAANKEINRRVDFTKID